MISFEKAYLKAKAYYGSVGSACEISGVWFFDPSEDLCIGGPIGYVIESGEEVFVNIASLINKDSVGKNTAKKLNTTPEELLDKLLNPVFIPLPNSNN